jgi:hypothetical protein
MGGKGSRRKSVLHRSEAMVTVSKIEVSNEAKAGTSFGVLVILPCGCASEFEVKLAKDFTLVELTSQALVLDCYSNGCGFVGQGMADLARFNRQVLVAVLAEVK